MPQHQLRLTARQLEVTSTDLEITVHAGEEPALLGTLKISKGSLDWRDAHDQQSYVLAWEKFRELAMREGTKKLRR